MARSIRYVVTAALFLAVSSFLSANEKEGAFVAIEQFSLTSQLSEGEVILGLVGFYGDPLPPQWLILSSVNEKPAVLKESVFARGKVVAERRFQKLPGQDLPAIPIRVDELQVDSREAFTAAETAAVEKGVSFDSVHYQLRCRESGKEPVWMLSLVNRAQVVVGVVYFSAKSGELLQASWPLLESRKLSDSRRGS